MHFYPELYFQKVKRDEILPRITYITLHLVFIAAAYTLRLTPPPPTTIDDTVLLQGSRCANIIVDELFKYLFNNIQYNYIHII